MPKKRARPKRDIHVSVGVSKHIKTRKKKVKKKAISQTQVGTPVRRKSLADLATPTKTKKMNENKVDVDQDEDVIMMSQRTPQPAVMTRSGSPSSTGSPSSGDGAIHQFGWQDRIPDPVTQNLLSAAVAPISTVVVDPRRRLGEPDDLFYGRLRRENLMEMKRVEIEADMKLQRAAADTHAKAAADYAEAAIQKKAAEKASEEETARLEYARLRREEAERIAATAAKKEKEAMQQIAIDNARRQQEEALRVEAAEAEAARAKAVKREAIRKKAADTRAANKAVRLRAQQEAIFAEKVIKEAREVRKKEDALKLKKTKILKEQEDKRKREVLLSGVTKPRKVELMLATVLEGGGGKTVKVRASLTTKVSKICRAAVKEIFSYKSEEGELFINIDKSGHPTTTFRFSELINNKSTLQQQGIENGDTISVMKKFDGG